MLFRSTSSNLANGTGYLFRVRGINSVGTSETGTISATATPYALATAPTTFVVTAPTTTVTANTSGKLALNFAAPADLGGGTLQYYLIQTSVDALTWTTGETTTVLPSNSSPKLISGLSNGTATYARIAAVTEVGIGTWASGNAIPRSVPDSITALTATGANSSLNLSWTAPANGGSAITGYAIYAALASDANYTQITSNTGNAQTSFSFSSIGAVALSNGVQYKVKVVAINSAGASADSVVVLGTPVGPADHPATILATASSNSSVALLWSQPAELGGGQLTGYRVEKSANGVDWTFVVTTDSATTTTNVTGLTAGITTFFRVAAITTGNVVGIYILA